MSSCGASRSPDSPDNRCPKTFPPQTCIYTTQGMLMCNAKGNEVPDVTTNIDLNIYQPYYHQTIQSWNQQPTTKQ